MFKKLSHLFFIPAVAFLVGTANLALSATSLVYHGEPDCPEELLK